MIFNLLRISFKEELMNLKSSKERIELCEKENLVYLGKGQVISKEDYNKVVIAENAIKYGDDLDD